MTYRELLDTLPTMPEKERADILGRLWSALTTLSKNQLLAFQQTWDGTRPFVEFVHEQNNVFHECILMETSPIGAGVRAQMNLPAITLDDEIQ
ncbi:MAG: hypothetical protein WC369_07200 [Dehalococcoidales bacterium]